MKYFLCLVSLWFSCSSFASEFISHPVLSQDLAHPPALEKCLRGILSPIRVKGFTGPFYATDAATGGKDKQLATYIVLGVNGTNYYWYFQAVDDSWRFFTYDTPTGTAIGMFAPLLSTRSVLTDASTGESAYPDLNPCSRFLGNR